MSEQLQHPLNQLSNEAPLQGPVVRPQEALQLAKIYEKYEGAIQCFGPDEAQGEEEDKWDTDVYRRAKAEGFSNDHIDGSSYNVNKTIEAAGGGAAYQRMLSESPAEHHN